MAKPRFSTFAELVSELGVDIDALIIEVLDKKRVVIGYNFESGEIESGYSLLKTSRVALS